MMERRTRRYTVTCNICLDLHMHIIKRECRDSCKTWRRNAGTGNRCSWFSIEQWRCLKPAYLSSLYMLHLYCIKASWILKCLRPTSTFSSGVCDFASSQKAFACVLGFCGLACPHSIRWRFVWFLTEESVEPCNLTLRQTEALTA